jgi:hypothetical protein
MVIEKQDNSCFHQKEPGKHEGYEEQSILDGVLEQEGT